MPAAAVTARCGATAWAELGAMERLAAVACMMLLKFGGAGAVL